MQKLFACVAASCVAFVASPSRADVIKPGLTLPARQLSLVLTAEIDATSSKFGQPTSFAPDISYGFSKDLTLGLTHSTYALTGFRGSAGKGVCVTGTDHGCTRVYNNVGYEGLYSLIRGDLALAANGGFHATNIDAGFFAAKLGVRVRYTRGPFSILTSPSVQIAIFERDRTPPNKDGLYFPVVATYKINPRLGIALSSGIKGPRVGFSSAWETPLGVIGTFAVSPQLGVGASWVFGKLVGGADDPPDPDPPATGIRYRAIQLWASYTR